MPFLSDEKNKEAGPVVILSESTRFTGVLRFKQALCIRGAFDGTIEAEGDLIVDKGARVSADHIYVNSITVHGYVAAPIHAADKVDLMSGAEVHGDLCAGRLRIADGVLFEGKCSMAESTANVAIFSLSTEEIKANLRPAIPVETHER